MTKSVLILGASGKIGTHAARAFGNAGWEVRRFDRKTQDMSKAAAGCDVIVNGMNPPKYHDWAGIIPAITAQVIAAAKTSGATVILPGNVYTFGDTPGAWSETTPHKPVSRKGRIRADMEHSYRESGVQTIVLRAGNFIDPDHDGDVMSLMVLNAVHRGKMTYPGPGDVVQPWCYLPDWARAAERLASRKDRLQTFEEVPFPGHALTNDQLRRAVEAQLGKPLRVQRFPWWAMRAAAPFWELARELLEMRYLWETSHWLLPDRFDALLPEFRATPLDMVIRGALSEELHASEAKRVVA